MIATWGIVQENPAAALQLVCECIGVTKGLGEVRKIAILAVSAAGIGGLFLILLKL